MKNFTIANTISIGWFGIPGKNHTGGKTHLVNESEDTAPLCGARLSPDAEYQWCFPTWRDGTPECERCKKIKEKMLPSHALTLLCKDTMKPKKTNTKLLKLLQSDKDVLIVGKALSHKVKNTVTNMKVHYSSATNEWATPSKLYNWLDEQYHFTLDPCCTRETAKCIHFYTQAEDGLSQDWGKETVFMNPPYGREIGIWVKKAYEASLKGATVVCLIPARTDTKWWHDYCLQADNICFFTGRVKFIENGVSLKAGAPFPSCAVTFQPPHSKNLALRCWWRNLKNIMA